MSEKIVLLHGKAVLFFYCHFINIISEGEIKNFFLQNLRFALKICFNINVNTHNLLTFGFGGVKCVII